MNNKVDHNKKLGTAGELFVVNYLKQQGFIICAQNYRKFFGEIDIIAHKKDMYIFVEVKTRQSHTIPMAQLISSSKQKKIIKTAQNFISKYKLNTTKICRFDVALVISNDVDISIDYIENAFTTVEEFYDY